MSAHRRFASRAATVSRRRMRAGRTLPVTFGFLVLGITAIAGTTLGIGWSGRGPQSPDERIVAAGLPRDVPVLGMVYEGLTPGGPGSLCAGAYQIGPQTCTHGPDPAPAGMDVRLGVQPVTGRVPGPVVPVAESARITPDNELVRDSGGSTAFPGAPALIPDPAEGDADFVLGSHGVACEGDGQTGRRVQALYAYERGTPSRYPEFAGSIQRWMSAVDRIVDATAADTGGSRHVRFVTTPGCAVDVTEVQLPPGSLRSFVSGIGALGELGYNRTDRKYLIFADTTVYCAIGTYVPDDRPGFGNRNNGGPSYGRVDAGCWEPAPVARELAQMLGALRPDARAGACPAFDCDHDDFFNTNPPPGNYLATHWNTAANDFLLRSDGGNDIPDASGASSASSGDGDQGLAADATSPEGGPAATGHRATGKSTPGELSASTTRRGGASLRTAGDGSPPDTLPGAGGMLAASGGAALPAGSGAPAETSGGSAGTSAAPVQAAVEVRDPTSTAVRLMWSTAGPGVEYRIAVDGRPVGTTLATRARLIGLRPDTSYTITVENPRIGYRAHSTGRTAPAARPTPGSWFLLTNALTGGAAELYAARADNGTPITLGDSDGGTPEQWQLVPAGDNGFTLRSRATGWCVQPLNADPAPGAPLVQGDCAAPGVPHFVLRTTGHGCTLRTAAGDLVIGVGAQRFGGDRVLTLQRPAGVRQQSWTALPA